MADDKNEKKQGKAKGDGAEAKAKGESKPKAEAKAPGTGRKKGPAQPSGPVPIHKRNAPPRLKTFYASEVVPKLMAEFKYANPMQVPRIAKVTLNMGLGEAVANPKIL